MSEKFILLARGIVGRYMKHHVSRASAGLSYFLMLTAFPLLICLYNMLGSLFPTAEAVGEMLRGLLPETALETLKEFIGYVSVNTNPRLLPVAVAAMLTSSAAGFRIIDSLMHELRFPGKRRKWSLVFSFMFSVFFLAALYLAAVMILSGGWFISLVDRYVLFVNISRSWQWLRFVVLFLLLFAMLLGIYRMTLPSGGKALLVPGAFTAALTLVGVSILFSWFIGMSAKYPLVYGSLASVMIMLLWLYICGNVLFLGNILNIALEELK